MAMGKLKFSAFLLQANAALLIASSWCLSGLLYAWINKAVQVFTSDDERVLSRPMNSSEISIMLSSMNLVALFVTPFTAFALSFSRKYSIVIFGIPIVLSWIAIGTTHNVTIVIISTAVAGIALAGRVVSLVYITEIVEDSFRGCLSTFVLAEFAVGTLFSNIPYDLLVYLNFTVSVLGIVLILFLKESPVLLVQKGKTEDAAKAIAFYRRVDVASKEVEVEINKIKLQLEISDETVAKESSFQFLKKSSSTKRALGYVVFLVVIKSFPEVVISYTAPMLLMEYRSTFTDMQIIYLIAILVCAGIVDRFGRKFLMKWTSAFLTVISLAIGVQFTFRFAPEWVMIILVYLYAFVCYLGLSTVPTLLAAEVFLPKVRGLCVATTMFVMLLIEYPRALLLVILMEILDAQFIFYIVSILCFIGALFSHYFLPETKGLSVDEIQPLFMTKGKNYNKN